MILPNRPRPISRMASGLKRAVSAVGGFFAGVYEYASVLYILARYPKSIGNIMGLTYPQPTQEKEGNTENQKP